MSGQPSTGSLAIVLAGETLLLLPERAVWWPATQTLFVADLHLGKAASFRALGQPVPSGTTRDNLDRLTQLVRRHAAQRLVFLGDFLHAAPAQASHVMEPANSWRAQHAALDCVLVRGNHDEHAGDPPAALRMQVVDEPWLPASDRPIAACHLPQSRPGCAVLAGHWHPAATLRGAAHDRLRLPCFCRVGDLLVLPAFGAFTGSTSRRLPRDASLYAVAAGRVWAV